MEKQGKSFQSKPKKGQKKRTQAQKVGRLKYIIRLEHRILEKLDNVERRQRILLAGYSDFLNLSEDYIRLVTCKDEVDKAILNELRRSTDQGILPSQLAERLSRFNISRQMVTYHIKQMNKRLKTEIGKPLAEKRGHYWALTPVLEKIETTEIPE